MAKETVSTLRESREWYWSSRAQGNTTRQVDLAIQLLFEGKRVLLHDHWESGNHERANKNLFNKVRDRLITEHRVSEKDVKINKVGIYWAIELKKEKRNNSYL